eukprot:c11814_g1_i1.p2 GENE.c11814_g1_i1~~c11814_g1_i1.p2  ORF type:complete len:186 (-),score=52.40 c11814_g1_i1:139-696(-)
MAAAKQNVVARLKEGNKSAARHALRRCRLIESTAERQRNAVFKLEQIMLQIEDASSHRQLFSVLQQSTAVMADLNKTEDGKSLLDQAEELASATADAIQDTNDVADALADGMGGMDITTDEELEKELAALVAADEAATKVVSPLTQQRQELPSFPTPPRTPATTEDPAVPASSFATPTRIQAMAE